MRRMERHDDRSHNLRPRANATRAGQTGRLAAHRFNASFGGDGFEIIGVSLDSERDKLDAFLKKEDGMTWPQFFDGQGWQNKLAVKYGVESIPFAVLIGPDGKIIDKNLRGEELENAVAGALAKK